jgi:hypothetical protein
LRKEDIKKVKISRADSSKGRAKAKSTEESQKLQKI